MAQFQKDKGLTLIELLITISVLAVIAAIALPLINNVVSSSNSNALQQTIKDADAFIDKHSKSGVVAYDGLSKTFHGYVDTDGDNIIDSNELVDSLTLDDKYSATPTGSAAVGGSYSNGGVTDVVISDSAGGAQAAFLPSLASAISGRTLQDVDGDACWSDPFAPLYQVESQSLFTWSAGGVDYYGFCNGDKSWWYGAISDGPVMNSGGSRTWALLEPDLWTPARGPITEYKLSNDLLTLVSF